MTSSRSLTVIDSTVTELEVDDSMVETISLISVNFFSAILTMGAGITWIWGLVSGFITWVLTTST